MKQWGSRVHRSDKQNCFTQQVGKAMKKMHDRKNVGKIILSPMKEPEPEPEPKPKAASSKTAAAEAEVPKGGVQYIHFLQNSWVNIRVLIGQKRTVYCAKLKLTLFTIMHHVINVWRRQTLGTKFKNHIFSWKTVQVTVQRQVIYKQMFSWHLKWDYYILPCVYYGGKPIVNVVYWLKIKSNFIGETFQWVTA